MTINAFGGGWTEDKLQSLSSYLDFYTKALKDLPFELVYIDAFAGTGRCRIDATGGKRVIDGSARIALDCKLPFARYHFIESNPRHLAELRELVAEHPRGKLVQLSEGSAANLLWPILRAYDWRMRRGVLFLDPFGLQCTWAMLKEIRETKALDVFFLVSLSGLYRQAAVDMRDVDEGKADRLTQFLGTDRWRTELYTVVQGDMFNEDQVTRKPGWEHILAFTTKRLRELFPYVAEPVVLRRQRGAPMHALYFAVSNPSGPAIKLASRVGDDILTELYT